jgi:hypothetical protein
MGWLENVNHVLQRYQGSAPSASPAEVSNDFATVAAHAPPSALSGGVAEAFRSGSTPPFGQMIADLFARSDPQPRAGILNQLIAAAGPRAGGVLGKLSGELSGNVTPQAQAGQVPTVTADQAQRVQPATAGELADHAQRNDASIVEQAGQFYSQHPKLVQGLGAAALALVMSHLSQRH